MLKVDATQRMSFDEFFEIELFKSEKSLKDLELQNAEERTINFIKRETIGWDLLELIELKQNENTNEQER